MRGRTRIAVCSWLWVMRTDRSRASQASHVEFAQELTPHRDGTDKADERKMCLKCLLSCTVFSSLCMSWTNTRIWIHVTPSKSDRSKHFVTFTRSHTFIHQWRSIESNMGLSVSPGDTSTRWMQGPRIKSPLFQSENKPLYHQIHK